VTKHIFIAPLPKRWLLTCRCNEYLLVAAHLVFVSRDLLGKNDFDVRQASLKRKSYKLFSSVGLNKLERFSVASLFQAGLIFVGKAKSQPSKPL
jgi:hypothetical protein